MYQTTLVGPNRPIFYDGDPYYRTCCGFTHVRQATIVIGVFELISLLLNIINWAVGYRTVQTGWAVGFGLSCLITVIVVLLLFYGVFRENRFFLIPHLIWQVLSIIGLFIAAILLLVSLVDGKQRVYVSDGGYEFVDHGSHDMWYYILSIIIYVATALIEIYCFFIVYKCFCWLREKLLFGYL